MSGMNNPAEQREPSHAPPRPPATGSLLADDKGRVGEFRAELGGLWYLRPVTGGTEWTVAPTDVHPADAIQRLHAETARANARSRGELL